MPESAGEVAWKLAVAHGRRQLDPAHAETVASSKGFGLQEDAADRYAERHWREYEGAAEIVLADRAEAVRLKSKHPMQDIYISEEDIARFRPNEIIRHLARTGAFNMNAVALIPDIDDDDRIQLAQLLGCSVVGLRDLDYAARQPAIMNRAFETATQVIHDWNKKQTRRNP